MQIANLSCRRIATRLRRLIDALRRDDAGASLVEFAIGLPIVTMLSMTGMEVANMAAVNMQVSQLATAVADNASRLGQTDNSGITPTISEADIDEILKGAVDYQAASLDFTNRGRIFLSSLEHKETVNAGAANEVVYNFIHWQRCIGNLSKTSSYGKQGDGKNSNTKTGIGANDVAAPSGGGVMFVEVFYQYKPLFSHAFGQNVIFRHEAAFIVRDDRHFGTRDSKGLMGTAANACPA